MSTFPSPPIKRPSPFRRLITAGLAGLLIVYLSIYAPTPKPRLTAAVALLGLVVVGKRAWSKEVAPLLGIIVYDLLVTGAFPAPVPDFWTVLQRPMFMLAGVCLATFVLVGRSLRAQYFVLSGILLMSLVGVAGELLGHDMTAVLPFEMPNDVFFDNITTDSSGAARIRGFFPESGVLGAACLSVATILGLGAVVLLLARMQKRLALAGLFSSVAIGGAILALTVTKSGAVMLAVGLGGFVMRMLCSQERRTRRLAAAGVLVAGLSMGAFLFLAPADLTSYYKGEIYSTLNWRDATPAAIRSNMGLFTRIEGWKAALYSLWYYPLGVGPWGLGRVLEHATSIRPTPELKMFFDMDVFGLKNSMANLIAETGWVGLGLLAWWMWQNFAAPARHCARAASNNGTLVAALYWASGFIALVLFASCELYPHFAFFILLKAHADAVSRRCLGEIVMERSPAERRRPTEVPFPTPAFCS